MDLTILNTNFDAVAIMDIYESFIWTDRYQRYGDFELYMSMRNDLLDYIKQEYYIQNNDSEHVMIIEKLLISSDVEDGNHITVSGRSLESILDRRIIWQQKRLTGNFQNAIHELLNECIISPSVLSRKIDNFVFEESSDPNITRLSIDAQYTGDNLYDVVVALCEERDIGFKIILDDKNQFVFKLYAGVDRSYDQMAVPYVIFSPNFENIINSNYVESKSSLKNVALIGGEGEGSSRRFADIGTESGLSRRELFVDARDISSDIGNDVILSDSEYASQLRQRGKEKLSEYIDIVSFEGQVETTRMFRYGEDFFNGDIIQIANEYGHESTARILEVVMSEDRDGTAIYPTFKTLPWKGDEKQ